jgi:hypothetical protein
MPRRGENDLRQVAECRVSFALLAGLLVGGFVPAPLLKIRQGVVKSRRQAVAAAPRRPCRANRAFAR